MGPGAMALAEELAQASCLPWRGCVRVCVSVCLSVCLPVVRLLSQEGRVLGGRRGDKVLYHTQWSPERPLPTPQRPSPLRGTLRPS